MSRFYMVIVLLSAVFIVPRALFISATAKGEGEGVLRKYLFLWSTESSFNVHPLATWPRGLPKFGCVYSMQVIVKRKQKRMALYHFSGYWIKHFILTHIFYNFLEYKVNTFWFWSAYQHCAWPINRILLYLLLKGIFVKNSKFWLLLMWLN